jgi:lipoic acid synthetase
MLGLGEEPSEVAEVLTDLRKVGCQALTLGQYLAPSRRHHPVARYVPPEEFDRYARMAREMGFSAVACGPLVRSSYRAGELWAQARQALSAGD